MSMIISNLGHTLSSRSRHSSRIPVHIICIASSSTRQSARLERYNSTASASFATTSSTTTPAKVEVPLEDEVFTQYVGELHRRKKRIEEKRKQKGGDFVDYLVVTVRGGKGGSGTSSFLPSRRGGLGPPSGGNGGPGGSVYLLTSPHLTSLSSVPKRLIGGQGGNGSGKYRHGRRGLDTYVTVPVGTVIREINREGEFEKMRREEEASARLGVGRLGVEERKARRRERWFIKYPGYEVGENDLREAETLLRSVGRWEVKTPSFEEEPPFYLDITQPIGGNSLSKSNRSYSTSTFSSTSTPSSSSKPTPPILLASGGLGGLGNPHFETPSTRHPRLASRGTQPPTRTFIFELKLLADVGLVGFPNAGKSTILRALTGRKGEVAGYAFTTLNPQVGVVRVMQRQDGKMGWGVGKRRGRDGEVVLESEVEREMEKKKRESGEYIPLPSEAIKEASLNLDSTSIPSILNPAIISNSNSNSSTNSSTPIERMRFTISDNPGLLARASENVGLGHSFLRSIERSLALAYVLDLTRPDPASDMMILKGELEAYQAGLSKKVKVVVINKADTIQDTGVEGSSFSEEVERKVGDVRKVLDEMELERGVEEQELGNNIKIVIVSGKYGKGLNELVNHLANSVEEARLAQDRAKENEQEKENGSNKEQVQASVTDFGISRVVDSGEDALKNTEIKSEDEQAEDEGDLIQDSDVR